MRSSKFNHTTQVLHREITRLHEIGEELSSEEFEKSSLYEKITELKAALRLLDGYTYKVN